MPLIFNLIWPDIVCVPRPFYCLSLLVSCMGYFSTQKIGPSHISSRRRSTDTSQYIPEDWTLHSQRCNRKKEFVLWQVTEMFTLLKVTLEMRIRSLSWLDEPTREAALHKLANLRGQFFTWPQLWNQTYVDSILQDVSCQHPLHVALCTYSTPNPSQFY